MIRTLLYRPSAFLFSLALAASAAAIDLEDTRLLADPTVSAERVAFVYDGDLWVAGLDGSDVRRLTSADGREQSPRFSPDGSLVAFTGEYDGNVDVFVVPTVGGVPQRLTWHPDDDLVQDFTPDGSAVLFTSRRQAANRSHTQLFTVPVDGGFPTRLPIPHGWRASWSPDGRKIAYIPAREAFEQWKHYRGGTTSRIWIYDVDDHSVQEVPQPDERCNDTDPVWVGGRLWFRSDRAGEFNLFSFEPASEVLEQHTFFTDFPVLRVSSSSDDVLVLEQAGWLHLFRPATNRTERLRIGVASDLLESRPRWVDGQQWIRHADLSPTGARVAFEYRGDVLSLPASKGDLRVVTASSAVHERAPVWSPDGSRLAWFSDQGGEYRLHVGSADGSGEVRQYELDGHGFYFDPRWSPDGRKLSFTDNSKSLYWIDLDGDGDGGPGSGKVTRVASEPHYHVGMQGPQHSWSPDSQWLAYSLHTRSYIRQLWLLDTRSGNSHPVTDGLSEASSPVFDRDGKHLFFFASTDAGPVKHWFAMSNADMEADNALYVAVLPADAPSPLAPESDEETGKEKEDTGEGEEKEGGADEAADVPAVRVDFDGLSQRILALPVARGPLTDLQTGEAGKVFWLRGDRDGEPSELQYFDLAKREEKTLASGVDGFTLSADGKKLLWRSGSNWGIADAGTPVDQSQGRVDVAKLKVKVDPQAEWRQIFDEAWRINRDYFYDPGMHGADWQAMGEKYEVFLDHLADRDDLNRVISWMCSELAVGHHRNGGGDQREEPERVKGGLLGADFEIADGRYRFAKVYGGLNWNPDLRSPLTEPGVGVRTGEYLIAVEGRELTAAENVHARFENTAGQVVQITVGPSPDGSGSRSVRVVPLDSEAALRNRDWVESNLRKVDAATGGRVAYVYVPNTTRLGHEYFKRYFFPQVHKEAIIVDERFNGGGQVADYYIDHLRRVPIAHWATRYGDDLVTPSAAIFGPKVMLVDENAGSGGDLLPWMFRKLGLGTLVGKRTWGGLVGVLGYPVLIDGGFVTAPNLAIWTEDGFVVENEGVPPDVEVEQWPAEVIAGRDPQLEKAIEIVLEQLQANPPADPERPPFPERTRP